MEWHPSEKVLSVDVRSTFQEFVDGAFGALLGVDPRIFCVPMQRREVDNVGVACVFCPARLGLLYRGKCLAAALSLV
jgi:hypothetical protein